MARRQSGLVGALGVVVVALLACKQSDSGSTGSSAPAVEQAPGTVKIAGIGIAGTAERAEANAIENAASGTQLLTASLSGVSTLCVGVAWNTPATSRRALFITSQGPKSGMNAQRVEPGASASVCLEDSPAGTYSLRVGQGASVAGAPEETLPAISVTFGGK